ncbi:hypothetical protein EV183_001081 [Coemansia sp. RSA 2336]|nr:hypothetical protein EV183_001081 [Coemansia sp. RSA 2336]
MTLVADSDGAPDSPIHSVPTSVHRHVPVENDISSERTVINCRRQSETTLQYESELSNCECSIRGHVRKFRRKARRRIMTVLSLVQNTWIQIIRALAQTDANFMVLASLRLF